MAYRPEVVERTMNVQEVHLWAMSQQLRWLQAAAILGWNASTVPRWRRPHE